MVAAAFSTVTVCFPVVARLAGFKFGLGTQLALLVQLASGPGAKTSTSSFASELGIRPLTRSLGRLQWSRRRGLDDLKRSESSRNGTTRLSPEGTRTRRSDSGRTMFFHGRNGPARRGARRRPARARRSRPPGHSRPSFAGRGRLLPTAYSPNTIFKSCVPDVHVQPLLLARRTRFKASRERFANPWYPALRVRVRPGCRQPECQCVRVPQAACSGRSARPGPHAFVMSSRRRTLSSPLWLLSDIRSSRRITGISA